MKRYRIALVVALALATPSLLAADFPEGAKNRFQFELGGAWDSFDTEARLDVTRGGVVSAGATIDFEKLLDVPVMETHFRGLGQWRFSNVSYVQFGFETISRAGRRVIDEEIAWGDVTYSAGARIDGSFDSTEVYLGYRFDMFRADNVKVGGTIGFSYWDVEGALTGAGTLTEPDGSTQEGSFEKGFGIQAPVPVIGIVVAVAIGASLFARVLPAGFIPEEDQGIFGVNVQLPAGASLERTSLVLKKVEDILATTDGLDSYQTVGGYGAVTSTYQSNYGTIFVRMKPWADRKTAALHVNGIMGGLRPQFAAIPEAVIFPFNIPTLSGFGAASGFNFLLQDRSGSLSVEQLGEQSQKFLAAARQRPELGTVFLRQSPPPRGGSSEPCCLEWSS